MDIDSLLASPEFDVALTGEIWADSTVSSVSSSSSLGGSVHLDVVDCDVLEVLGVGVGFEILDQSENGVDGLLWPSTEGLSELFGLSSSSDSTIVLGVRNTSSLGEDILEISFGLG